MKVCVTEEFILPLFSQRSTENRPAGNAEGELPGLPTVCLEELLLGYK